MRVDGVLGHLADHPHDSAIAPTNDSNDWFFLFCVQFEVFEAFFSVGSQVVEVHLKKRSFEVEVNSIDLTTSTFTSCSLRVRPIPLPEELLKNMKILHDTPSPYISSRFIILYFRSRASAFEVIKFGTKNHRKDIAQLEKDQIWQGTLFAAGVY